MNSSALSHGLSRQDDWHLAPNAAHLPTPPIQTKRTDTSKFHYVTYARPKRFVLTSPLDFQEHG